MANSQKPCYADWVFKPCACILALLILAASISASAEPLVLPIAASQDYAYSYKDFLNRHGGSPYSIDDFAGTTRGVTSLVLMQQAARIGGMPFEVNVLESPNPGRAMLLVKQGKAAAFASDMWQNEFDDTVIMSPPVVRKGEFEKGIYGLRENSALMAVRSLKELRTFSTAVDLTWQRDIETLTAMGIHTITKVPRYELMIRVVGGHRTDFIIAEFANVKHDFSFTAYGVKLYPVPDVKIVIPHSRHFMFSKAHPMGARLAKAVNCGMKQLRKQGRIRKALEQCGFINTGVAKWKQIYP